MEVDNGLEGFSLVKDRTHQTDAKNMSSVTGNYDFIRLDQINVWLSVT